MPPLIVTKARVLGDWASFTGRAALRSTQAMGDLMHDYTVYSLLQWQSHLLNTTFADWMETKARILRLVTHKA